MSESFFEQLRRRAEEIVAVPDGDWQDLSPDKVRALVHELGVHQTELRLQNEELQRTEQELLDLYELAPVGLMSLDEAGIIRKANHTLADLLGVKPADLLRGASVSWMAEEDRGRFIHFRARLARSETVEQDQMRLRRKDGGAVVCALRGRRIRSREGGAVEYRIAVSNLCEAERAERRLSHLNAVLRSIRNVNQMLANETDPVRLLERACLCLTETRGYRNAWIARFDAERNVDAVFESQLGENLPRLREWLAAGGLPPCFDKALAREAAVTVRDPFEKCGGCPVAPAYRGFVGITAPLRHGATIFGMLTVSIPPDFVDDEEERDLVREVADDIGFAMNALAQEAAREAAEEKLRTASLVINSSPAVLFEWRAEEGWPVAFVSDNVAQYGYAAADLLSGAVPYARLVHPEDMRRVAGEVAEYTAAGRDTFTQEYRLVRADGEVRWVDDRTTVIRDGTGEVLRYQGILLDITERKRAEDALDERIKELRCLFETSKILAEAEAPLGEKLRRIAELLPPSWQYPEIACARVEFDGEEYRSGNYRDSEFCLSAPIRIDGVVRGRLEVCYLEPRPPEAEGPFLQEESDLLEELAARINAAVRRREMEEAIRRNEQRLAVTLDSIGDAVIATDVMGRITRMNAVAEALTGYAIAEALSRPLTEIFRIVNAKTREPAENPVDRVLLSGKVVGLANHTALVARAGGERQIADSAAPIRDRDGTVLGVVLVFRDVTDEYAMQEELAASEEKYRLAMEVTSDGLWDWNLTADAVTWSPRCYTMLGYEPDEFPVTFERWRELVHPDDLDRAWREIEAQIREDGNSFAVEFRYRRKDGDWHWVLGRGKAIAWDEEGEVTRMIGTHADVHALKCAEEALRASEARYRSVFEHSPVGIALVEVDTYRLVRVNPQLCVLLDYDREELIGKTLQELTHPEDREVEASHFRELVRGAISSFVFEKRDIARDGSERWVNVLGTLLPDVEGQPRMILKLVEDIGERKRLEEQLLQSQKMEAIGQLAGGVAHDFNNQLAGIMGYADMLAKRLDDETLRRYAQNVLIGARRAADLTKQLLAYARKGQYQSIPVDMHRIIGEVVNILEHSIDRRIHIQQLLRARVAMTKGDPSQLQNAILNLALNARDAMPEGGELIFETEMADLDEAYCARCPFELLPGLYLRISITDSGEGMDEETKQRMFEPFFTTKPEGQGTGMGLASVYGTVKTHRGASHVYSDVGHGTTVTVYLPLTATARARAPAATASVPASHEARVLVVEDEELIREMALDMLRGLGYKVTACENGAEAVAYYEQAWSFIDLVILDMIMPQMNGHQTFLAMRRINPEIKALLATGYSLNGEAQSILDEGVLGFVQKPFDITEFSREVARVLGTETDETV